MNRICSVVVRDRGRSNGECTRSVGGDPTYTAGRGFRDASRAHVHVSSSRSSRNAQRSNGIAVVVAARMMEEEERNG